MKRIIVLSMILSFSFLAKAQCSLPYKSLAAFNNDTTAFISYNFSTRAVCYVGKTLKDVIQDLGIHIQSFITSTLGRNGFLYNGIYIYIYPFQTVMQFVRKHQYPNFITITWAIPLSKSSFDSVVEKSDPYYKWTPQIANLVMNLPIQSIDIVHY